MNFDHIKTKVSLRFFSTVVLLAFIALSLVVSFSEVELYLVVLGWVPVLLFLVWWKNICIDSKIVFENSILRITAPRVARENLPVILAITLEKIEIPVQEITAIKLWRNSHPLVANKIDNDSSLNKFVGKGQLTLSLDIKDRGKRDFDVNSFNYDAIKSFLSKHFQDRLSF